VETPQHDTWNIVGSQLGHMSDQAVTWDNYMETPGMVYIGGPMRGFHVETSHWLSIVYISKLKPSISRIIFKRTYQYAKGYDLIVIWFKIYLSSLNYMFGGKRDQGLAPNPWFILIPYNHTLELWGVNNCLPPYNK
jgi:hypothetical protein